MEEPIVVKKAKFGRGVFATRDIKKGEKVCIMKGRKITSNDLVEERARERNIMVDPFQIGRDTYLQLAEPYIYFNHSCDPNVGFLKNVHMVAIKNIKKGEEIFYDYSSVWYEGMPCRCGSKKCRKYIGDFYSIPKVTREKYRRLHVVPDFIK